eukprot:CAMPEP_0185585922 /NCGR_PEP_ID=MMETSP0434-20130131/41723_1 /TAXON_ID=626734 ORGANISM="Favella taraikaensis, Strain Fe Narragansett Bay" /NCGR_SAMPLE_ID=MMETSP0434 /ASSEMBLY_ACC=CAM_ASM_000379 /LENGTH=62 /DNA_ID=CAMNT_0028206645 /DNA_START=17 /DNA_END=202 /DNA_ORIENTATION=-
MTDEEIAEKLTELDKSGDGKLSFDEFAEFMSGVLSEPGHTQDDVTAAFRELADDAMFIPVET